MKKFIPLVFFVLMLIFYAASFMTETIIKMHTYVIFDIFLNLFVLSILWIYMKKVYKRGASFKNVMSNLIFIVLGVAVISVSEVVVRLGFEYFAFPENTKSIADNVFSYIVKVIPSVYINNTSFALKLIVNELFLILIYVLDIPGNFVDDMKYLWRFIRRKD